MLVGEFPQLIAWGYQPQVGQCVAIECVLAIGVAINIKHLGNINPCVHVEVVVGRTLARDVTHLELQRVAVMYFWLDLNHFSMND